ncbi:DUF397 domain-containing protein [Amycolatopsis sp. NPDC059021]|uniref:DUF397 domain-containing protein n=1 Tax=Amycolatopsis sp. NPDC059021 TaxID=3346704 RepID=UPI0036725C65
MTERTWSDVDLTGVAWRKSSFSAGNGACVEVAPLPDGRIAMRNSNHPGSGAVFFTRAEMSAYLNGVKSGEFDDLT